LNESELFSYEKGDFTGAERTKRGMFELAHKGSLFFDEIRDLPMTMQAKLLRVLQEGEIQRLSAEKALKVDGRILAATKLSLAEQMKLGNFRSDLYYRINVIPITTPPLRKRKEYIPLLVEYFINYFDENIQEISVQFQNH
jgi:transcriptional regulator with GAF, ATPase, and Fis domain